MLKRVLSVLLCAALSISFLSSWAFATKLDDNELPGVIVGPVQPVANRKLMVSAPAGWDEVYAYTWMQPFPGALIPQKGDVFSMEISGNITNLILSTPDHEEGYRQIAEILLENNGKDVAVIIATDGSHRVCYGIMGDVTGDGKLNIGDPARLYSHLRGSSSVSDAAALLFADITGDGRVNMGDVAKIYAQIRETRPVI